MINTAVKQVAKNTCEFNMFSLEPIVCLLLDVNLA